MNPLFDMEAIPVQKEASGKSNEWYTQAKYIEAARSVMGSIELDPASCEEANRTVKAKRYYTEQDNGLLQDWTCEACWLNPPYTRTPEMRARHQSTIALFMDKLLSEYQIGRVKQAITLVSTQVDARWFRPLWQFPLCFSDHKIHFNAPGGRYSYTFHMFGTCFVYLGPNISSFVKHFTQFGPVITPDGVHRKLAPTPQPTLWDYTEGQAS